MPVLKFSFVIIDWFKKFTGGCNDTKRELNDCLRKEVRVSQTVQVLLIHVSKKYTEVREDDKEP